MATTLTTPPPVDAYSGDGIYLELETDLLDDDCSYFEITVSGSPAAGQKLTISWPGGSVTYTATDPASGYPDEWPLKPAAQSVSDYAEDIADFLRDGALLSALFTITHSAGVITVKHRINGEFDLAVDTNTMSGIAVAVTNSAAAAPPDNLRAVVRVFALEDPNAGAYTAGEELLGAWASFNTSGPTLIDIQAAFPHLAPWLPDENSIARPSYPPPSSWYSALAQSVYQQYRIRFGEQYGRPATIGNLTSGSDTFSAILGAHSGAALNQAQQVYRMCHDYTRRDGQVFRKPVSQEQPDWIYVWTGDFIAADLPASLTVVIRWSDGTTSNYTPFASMPTLTPRSVYVFSSGYRQLRLPLVSPSGGTDPDAYIVGYTVRIGPQDDSNIWLAEMEYDVEPLCHPWNMYLAFTTGRGGIETVWLRGKSAETFPVESDEFQRPRWGSTRPTDFRDYELVNAQGRPVWEVSTGWYSDSFYLVHLRQLPLAKCWMIDLDNGRFLPVTVLSTDSPVAEDDQPLHTLNLKIRAGWYDTASNL